MRPRNGFRVRGFIARVARLGGALFGRASGIQITGSQGRTKKVLERVVAHRQNYSLKPTLGRPTPQGFLHGGSYFGRGFMTNGEA